MSNSPCAIPGVEPKRNGGRAGVLRAVMFRRLPWWAEAALVAVAYELYNAIQALTSGDLSEARAHGLALERLERHLHIWVEPNVNHFVTAHSWLAVSLGYYYALAHVTVTFAVLIILRKVRPDAYAVLRNALLALSLVALVAFWWWPVGPPRLTVQGFTDTLARYNILGAAHVHGGLVNLYASMPSLHVAWAVWCAGAVAMTSQAGWRHLVWMYPALTTFVVIATANHYLLDAVAGAVLAAVALSVARRYLSHAARFRRSTIDPDTEQPYTTVGVDDQVPVRPLLPIRLRQSRHADQRTSVQAPRNPRGRCGTQPDAGGRA